MPMTRAIAMLNARRAQNEKQNNQTTIHTQQQAPYGNTHAYARCDVGPLPVLDRFSPSPQQQRQVVSGLPAYKPTPTWHHQETYNFESDIGLGSSLDSTCTVFDAPFPVPSFGLVAPPSSSPSDSVSDLIRLTTGVTSPTQSVITTDTLTSSEWNQLQSQGVAYSSATSTFSSCDSSLVASQNTEITLRSPGANHTQPYQQQRVHVTPIHVSAPCSSSSPSTRVSESGISSISSSSSSSSRFPSLFSNLPNRNWKSRCIAHDERIRTHMRALMQLEQQTRQEHGIQPSSSSSASSIPPSLSAVSAAVSRAQHTLWCLIASEWERVSTFVVEQEQAILTSTQEWMDKWREHEQRHYQPIHQETLEEGEEEDAAIPNDGDLYRDVTHGRACKRQKVSVAPSTLSSLTVDAAHASSPSLTSLASHSHQPPAAHTTPQQTTTITLATALMHNITQLIADADGVAMSVQDRSSNRTANSVWNQPPGGHDAMDLLLSRKFLSIATLADYLRQFVLLNYISLWRLIRDYSSLSSPSESASSIWSDRLIGGTSITILPGKVFAELWHRINRIADQIFIQPIQKEVDGGKQNRCAIGEMPIRTLAMYGKQRSNTHQHHACVTDGFYSTAPTPILYNVCSVCLGDIVCVTRLLCGHRMCFACWLASPSCGVRCPTCKFVLPTSDQPDMDISMGWMQGLGLMHLQKQQHMRLQAAMQQHQPTHANERAQGRQHHQPHVRKPSYQQRANTMMRVDASRTESAEAATVTASESPSESSETSPVQMQHNSHQLSSSTDSRHSYPSSRHLYPTHSASLPPLQRSLASAERASAHSPLSSATTPFISPIGMSHKRSHMAMLSGANTSHSSPTSSVLSPTRTVTTNHYATPSRANTQTEYRSTQLDQNALSSPMMTGVANQNRSFGVSRSVAIATRSPTHESPGNPTDSAIKREVQSGVSSHASSADSPDSAILVSTLIPTSPPIGPTSASSSPLRMPVTMSIARRESIDSETDGTKDNDSNATPTTTANAAKRGHGYSCHHCLAGDTAITLNDGFSRPIRDVAVGTLVLSLDKVATAGRTEVGFVAKATSALLDQGVKECVELLFSDGRTITCTPDHRFLTADGHWITAEAMTVGITDITAGMEYPHLAPLVDADAKWELDLTASLGFKLNARAGLARSLAFAGLLGYLLTGGRIYEDGSVLYPGHPLDVKAIVRDIHLLTGIAPTTSRDGTTWTINFPTQLHQAMVGVGASAADHLEPLSHFPAFLMSPTCPVPVVQTFIGGLFGGDGKAPSLKWTRELVTGIGEIRFSLTHKGIVQADQTRVTTEELQCLMMRCGIPKEALGENLSSNVESGVDPKESDSIVWSISTSATLPFARSVGFRYCCHKQLRLTGACAYYRLAEALSRQKKFISDAILAEEAACRGRTLGGDSEHSELMACIKEAKAQLAKQENVHPDIMAWKPTELNDATQLGMDIHAALHSFDALKFFSTPVTDAVVYGVDSEVVLPTFRVRLIGKRAAGSKATYDLSVPGTENFIANGITVHNCKTTKPVSHLFICTSKTPAGAGLTKCRKKYCSGCLRRLYSPDWSRKDSPPGGVSSISGLTESDVGYKWTCPSCASACVCASCERKAQGSDAVPPRRKKAHIQNQVELTAERTQTKPKQNRGGNINTPRVAPSRTCVPLHSVDDAIPLSLSAAGSESMSLDHSVDAAVDTLTNPLMYTRTPREECIILTPAPVTSTNESHNYTSTVLKQMTAEAGQANHINAIDQTPYNVMPLHQIQQPQQHHLPPPPRWQSPPVPSYPSYPSKFGASGVDSLPLVPHHHDPSLTTTTTTVTQASYIYTPTSDIYSYSASHQPWLPVSLRSSPTPSLLSQVDMRPPSEIPYSNLAIAMEQFPH